MNNILYKTAKALLYHSPSISKSTLCKIFGGKWIVISGASHGIGKALALKLIEAGADLFLIARTESELQFLHDKARQNGCNVRISVTDLRNRNELDRLCSVLKELPRVDFFFCNAGKSIHRRIEDALDRMHDYDRTIDLNYKSLVALSLTLIPKLQQSGGKIIYTSSTSCLYPAAPGWSAYHASKCAANIWCQTADSELKHKGVRVQIAYMPLVHTTMSDATEMYRKLPAFSAEEAADILLSLSISNKRCYKPWWASLTEIPAICLSPLIRKIYCLKK